MPKSITEILDMLEQAAQEPAKPEILILGSVFMDLLIEVSALPKSGGDVSAKFDRASAGGCSFNVADVLQKLKLPFDTLLPVGEGFISDLAAKALTERGLKVERFAGCGDNGWCLSLIEPDGERSFVTMPGIETRFERQWLEALPLDSCRYVYLSGYQTEGANAEVMLDGLRGLNKDAVVVYDPGPRTPYIDPEFFERIEREHRVMYTINQSEACTLTGRSDVEAAAAALYARTHTPCVITRGAQGALLHSKAGGEHIPGFKIKLCDTVGSGDSHTGGILAGVCAGLKLNDAVYLANAVAAYVSAHSGAACAPTLAELKDFSACCAAGVST